MKKIAIVFTVVCLAVFVVSCDPVQIDIVDLRKLESISLSLSNIKSTWKAGEERILTIEVFPENAVVEKYEVICVPENGFEIKEGAQPNQFIIMARKDGNAVLKAIATDINGVVAKQETSFRIEGNYVPKLHVRYKGEDMLEDKIFPKVKVCDVLDEFDVCLSSDNTSSHFEMESSDGNVVSIEQSSEKIWKIRAISPGKVNLTVRLTDRFGDKVEKIYEIISLGHIKLKTEFSISYLTLGLSVLEYDYKPSLTTVEFDGYLYGWPEGCTSHRYEYKMTSLKSAIVFEQGASYNDLLDLEPDFNAFYSLPPYVDKAGVGHLYAPHGADLKFILTLDNPYIIIDEVIDDSNIRYPNFKTYFLIKQEGKCEAQDVEDDSVSSEERPSNGGWWIQDENIELQSLTINRR